MDAEAWDQRYAARYAEGGLVWSAEPNRFVAEELADLPPGRALDLAAGEGRNAIWLAGRGWQVTAADFSQVALDQGRRVAEQAGVPVEWLRADATTWLTDHPDRRDGYDLVLLAYLQLPAPERRAAVRAAWRSLRPGGTLLLVAHDSSNLTEGVGGPSDPAVLMTADDVLGDLDGLTEPVVLRAGRVAREVEPGHGDPPPAAPRTAYDCLVRAVRPA